MTRTRDTEQGFTLIELLVVILIIGILAGIAIPAFLNHRKEATAATMKSDLKNAITELETSYIKNREYPSTLPETVKTSDGNVIELGGVTATTPTQTELYPLNQIPRSALNSTNSFVYDLSVETNPSYISSVGVPGDGVTKETVGVFVEFISPSGSNFDVKSRMVLFDPERTEGQYIQGFASGHALHGHYWRHIAGGSCENGATYSGWNRSTIMSGDPAVVSVTGGWRYTSCRSHEIPAISHIWEPNQFSGYTGSGRFPRVTFLPGQFGVAPAPSEGPKNDFCLTVRNPAVDTVYSINSLDSTKVREGEC